MSRPLLICSSWALCLLLWAGAALADFKKDYQDGVAAAQKSQWADARRLMRAALAEESAPKVRMLAYGTVYIPYVPHYYLGLANAGLSDCAGAVSAFNTPASKAVVAKLAALAAEQQRQLARCESMLAAADSKPPTPPLPSVTTPPIAAPASAPVAAVTAPIVTTPPATAIKSPVAPPVTTAPAALALTSERVAPASGTLGRIDRQIVSIERQLRAPPLAGTSDAKAKSRSLETLRKQRQDAGASLERARTAGDAKLLASVETQAGKLESDLRTLIERIASSTEGLVLAQERSALELARSRVTEAIVKLDQSLARATEAGIGTSASATALRSASQTLQGLIASTDRAAIERGLAAVAGTSKQLETAIAAVPELAPAPLRELVGWYLAANYAQVAQWDALSTLPDARARAQAHLVRAAARWQLYVRDGEQDGDLRAAIDTDLRDAKRLDRALKPNGQAFSPKLLLRFAAL